ncbi:phosphoanhydride phosphohydrolase [Xanthomonas translucens pv. arrhenatheri]|uniref:Histidine acid phosphatase n=1 Tax=Xanthomonas graminis pv. arrhenatheri LMG 727 TaxID=1195923 RepID=A0A0K2ZDT0_9XANT|nr:histidine-type phosphatase [Xanthomonas translucens]OAX64634.1 phosphoanhydride phosphohydrolase [Xanthomonas translucens pv. arrhenatheri]UKE76532.1 histidine-type phosphatase [Xanthomonas translucens pv. arrhenatheri]CTP82319.1 Histidine acid phosphatase [Xanthomonas translucens pv. arrhenatheri LMG 727]
MPSIPRLAAAALLVLAALPFAAVHAAAAAPQDTLEKVLILKRHGVRSAMSSAEQLGRYSARPWPRFGVPAGHLTENGARLEALFGAYYRARYAAQGLFAGDACASAYYWANRTQRTIASARALASTLTPGCANTVHSVADGASDPLFDGAPALRTPAASALMRAAIAGRIGGDAAAWNAAQRDAIDTLQQLLLQCAQRPCPADAGAGKQRLDAVAARMGDTDDGIPGIEGPAAAASGISESLLMGWADGQDFATLGWQGLDEASLLRAFAPHQAEFALRLRAPAVARMAASPLAARVLATLQQGSGNANGSATHVAPIGGAARLVVLSGHDGTLTLLAGMLDLHWQLPGYQPDQTVPGGALVFERWRRADGQRVIRLRYTAQSLAQLRERRTLTLQAPPPSAPVFIPGCSSATPGYDCALPTLATLIGAAIDPQFLSE